MGGKFFKFLLKIKFLQNNFFKEKLFKPLKELPLIHITKNWLNKNEIIYNRFIFEKGNDYSSDPRGEFTNRFYVSRRKKIKYFIEDDLEKAVKLSFICDVVFLISHPYNLPNNKLSDEINEFRSKYPSNIIRVNSWEDIYKNIRKLS
ncbi:hypothetical protein GF354_05210 [Candidatus Peregrinibacteria bacterium]|nr:hypothetical protein [Candidatus Peregrinibacteria bacterium]